MKIEYVANDGKKFEDEQDCIDYENEIMYGYILTTEGKAFYGNWNKVTSVKELQDIYFIGFSSLQALERFNEVSEVFGLEGIKGYDKELPLAFYYDNEKYQFIQYGDKIKELEKQLDELKKEQQLLL